MKKWSSLTPTSIGRWGLFSNKRFLPAWVPFEGLPFAIMRLKKAAMVCAVRSLLPRVKQWNRLQWRQRYKILCIFVLRKICAVKLEWNSVGFGLWKINTLFFCLHITSYEVVLRCFWNPFTLLLWQLAGTFLTTLSTRIHKFTAA